MLCVFQRILAYDTIVQTSGSSGTFLMMRIEEIEPHMKFLRNGSASLKNIEAGVTTSVLAEEYQINNALQNVQLCFLYRLYI